MEGLCVISPAFPATSRPQTKRFKLVNALVLPGQADVLTTCSLIFLFLGLAAFGPPLEKGVAEYGIGGALQLPFGLRIVSILWRYVSLGT